MHEMNIMFGKRNIMMGRDSGRCAGTSSNTAIACASRAISHHACQLRKMGGCSSGLISKLWSPGMTGTMIRLPEVPGA